MESKNQEKGKKMGFYDDSKKVDQYIEMCSNYDGGNIYGELKKYLNDGQSILELGTGPGFDIAFLNEHYQVTGSDFSDEFLLRLKNRFRNIPFLKIDARSMEIKHHFDCIYSNKVLHHLTRDELAVSLSSQINVLSSNGIIAHTFWIGEEDQTMDGLLFTYYREEEILNIISKKFKVLSAMSYQEFEKSDSLLIIAQSNNVSE